MNEFIKIKEFINIIVTLLAFFYGVFRLVAFLTPENRKNLRSNVGEIKAAAAAKKKHLIGAILSFAMVVALIAFFFWDKLDIGTSDNYDMNAVNSGDIVEFGGGKEKIEWIVIERNKRYWTLLSVNCLEAKPYQTTIEKGKKLMWEESSLKKWLNSEFVKNFSESERNMMVEFDEGGFVTLLDIKQAKKLEKENMDLLMCRT